eukprot:jgi/Mesvir1/5418/Mv15481-RA.1
MMGSKLRWGDSADIEDEEEAGFAYHDSFDGDVPAPMIIGPDEKGIKIVIEFRKNDDGILIKTTKKLRVKKQNKKMSKAVIERRHWAKFGDARTASAIDNKTRTMISVEEIFLERANVEEKKDSEKQQEQLNVLAAGGNTSLLVCRTCGKKGDHWTAKCPYKDLAARGGQLDDAGDDEPGAVKPLGAPGKGSYIPPSLRAGASAGRGEGESMNRRGRDDNAVRVTNLSEDTREADLQELFGTFGPISRVFIAVDRDTGQSRGFGFVNFHNRESAQRAIDKLDGYGYDNLILRVEWATPRTDK